MKMQEFFGGSAVKGPNAQPQLTAPLLVQNQTLMCMLRFVSKLSDFRETYDLIVDERTEFGHKKLDKFPEMYTLMERLVAD